MINLRNSPFLWLALVLLFTCMLGEWFPIHHYPSINMYMIAAILITGLFTLWAYPSRRYYLSTLFLTLFIIASGLLHQGNLQRKRYPLPPIENAVWMSGSVVIRQVLKIKTTHLSLSCRPVLLSPVYDTLVARYTDAQILVLLRQPEEKLLLPGDTLEVKGWVSQIKGPLNPYAFDAAAYYMTIGIRHQLSGKWSDVTCIPTTGSSFARITARWQATLSQLVKSHTSPNAAQLINALVWGDRSDMAAEVRDAFAEAGAMHVLSVSGMHVAMIYSLLYLLLGAPGDGTAQKRMIRFGLYAIAILLYVGLTGACPAVVRAGLMILLYLFGKSMGWNTQVWNLIGFAAFIMLWINPSVFQHIGFQLSFLAMAGILLYAKPIIRSYSSQHKLLQWTWEIIAMSIAAQIFILPVILRQFHQFPLTFMLSSIAAVPAGYVVIFGAIINVMLSMFHIDFLWGLLDHASRYFILTMQWMASLNPEMNYSLPERSQTFLLLMAICFSFSLLYQWAAGKVIAYSLAICVLIQLSYHRIRQWSTREIIIYHSYRGVLIDVFEGAYCYSIQDAALTSAQIEFPSRGYRCHRDVLDVTDVQMQQNLMHSQFTYENYMLRAGPFNMELYDGKKASSASDNSVTHILILDCPDPDQFAQYAAQHPEASLILMASCPRQSAQQVHKFAAQTGKQVYDINVQGYLNIPL